MAFLASDGEDYQEGGTEIFYIYLSSDMKRHEFDLMSMDYNNYYYTKEENSFTYEATLEGTAKINHTTTISYNSTLKKMELVQYTSSCKLRFNVWAGITYNCKTGKYTMICDDMANDTVITKKEEGQYKIKKTTNFSKNIHEIIEPIEDIFSSFSRKHD